MKEPQRISTLLAAVLPSAGDIPAPAGVQRQLADFWREHSGAAGMHSWPLLFTSGRLVVFAESASWGMEIRHRSDSLMTALAEHGIRVSVIEVKTRPGSFGSLIGARKTGNPPRLSPKNAGQIESLAETIDHPRLKQSLLRLARRADKKHAE